MRTPSGRPGDWQGQVRPPGRAHRRRRAIRPTTPGTPRRRGRGDKGYRATGVQRGGQRALRREVWRPSCAKTTAEPVNSQGKRRKCRRGSLNQCGDGKQLNPDQLLLCMRRGESQGDARTIVERGCEYVRFRHLGDDENFPCLPTFHPHSESEKTTMINGGHVSFPCGGGMERWTCVGSRWCVLGWTPEP